MTSQEQQSAVHFVGNRFKSIFEKAIDSARIREINPTPPVVLTYWDTYFGELPAFDDWMKGARYYES